METVTHGKAALVCTLRNVLKTNFGLKKERKTTHILEAHFEESGSGKRWALVFSDIIPPTAETHAVTAATVISCVRTRCSDGLLFHSARSWKVWGVWDADTSRVIVFFLFFLFFFTGTSPPSPCSQHPRTSIYTLHLTRLPIYTLALILRGSPVCVMRKAWGITCSSNQVFVCLGLSQIS